MSVEYLGHQLLREDGAVRGYLRIEQDRVMEICEGSPPADTPKGLILPSFVNAHTHIGDSVAYPAPKGTIEQLVAPPCGYKHRVLRATSRQVKVEAMRVSLSKMIRTGTSSFVDFREEGEEGVLELKEALEPDGPDCVVLGRPKTVEASNTEIRSLLESCDGFGLSALSDWPYDFLERMSMEVEASGKMLSMHVSEGAREDIGRVLDLKPDLLVHMNQASEDDLRLCAAEGLPVVVCPRSNEFFGLRPDIPRMVKFGLEVCLGSDNAMISVPDMLEEARAAWRLCGMEPLEAIRLATFSGHKVLSGLPRITRNAEDWANLVVIAVGDEDPLRRIVESSTADDVTAVVRGGRIRRARDWSR